MNQHDSDSANPYKSPSAEEMESSIDDGSRGKRLSDDKPSNVRYGVIASLCMVAIVAYIQRISIGVAEQDIRNDLGLTKIEMGWVMSAFFWSYAIFQIPTGAIGQWMGTRKALSMFVALFSTVAGLFSFGTGWLFLASTRVGMGIGQAGTFPCAVQSISKWIPTTERARSAGFLGGSMSIGAAIGVAMTGVLLPIIGWKVTFVLFCLPGWIFAVWFYRWFRDTPDEHPSANEAEADLVRGETANSSDSDSDSDAESNPSNNEAKNNEPKDKPSRARFRYACWAIFALCGQQVCRAAGYMFFGSWFATYLRETRGVADLEAGVLNSLPLFAIVIGCPLGGVLSDWVLARTGSLRLSRQGVGAAAMLACCVMILLSYPVANPWLAVLLISGGSFFAAFGGPCAYTATIDMGGRHTPIVFSTMNMMGNFGAAIFPMVVPFMLNEDSSGRGNWDLVLFTFAGLYFVAAIFWMMADTKACIDSSQSQ